MTRTNKVIVVAGALVIAVGNILMVTFHVGLSRPWVIILGTAGGALIIGALVFGSSRARLSNDKRTDR